MTGTAAMRGMVDIQDPLQLTNTMIIKMGVGLNGVGVIAMDGIGCTVSNSRFK
jgi:hypothetical protein